MFGVQFGVEASLSLLVALVLRSHVLFRVLPPVNLEQQDENVSMYFFEVFLHHDDVDRGVLGDILRRDRCSRR